MPLLKETGAGLPNASSYADASDGDAYHEAHLYATAWTGASLATKEAALVMATRLIDAACQFNGRKASLTQSLQWPRTDAPDPDRASQTSPFFPGDSVPVALVHATCELARELLKCDSTDAPDGEGLQSLSIAGALDLKFDKKGQQPLIPETARLYLSKLGTYIPRGGAMVPLIRV